MSSSFFQKLGRTSQKSETPTASPIVQVSESRSERAGINGSPSVGRKTDIKFKTVKVTRPIQKPLQSVYSQPSKSYQFDILKRLNKRKRAAAAPEKEKPEREKKPSKEKQPKQKKQSKKESSAKSSEFVTSEDDESEEYSEEEEEEEEEIEANDADQHFGSDTDGEDQITKKHKSVQAFNENRDLLDESAFLEFDKEPKIIHAESLVTAYKSDYEPSFSEDTDDIELEYPGAKGFTEKYKIMTPNKENFDPVADIETNMKIFAKFYVPEEDSKKIFTADLQDCIVRRMKRALKRKSAYAFRSSVDEYNKIVEKYFRAEAADISTSREFLLKSLRIRSNITIVSHDILSQVYARVVSPHVSDLRNYAAFSNNVYGELLPNFVSKLFKDLGMDCSSVFVDLGSGVGNCVLQAALELGCESYGCEMMPRAHELAEVQKTELIERARLWGLKPGQVKLIGDDFVHNDEIKKVLTKSDIVLVNNYAFDAELNGNLIHMFLDLRDGTKIISLKSFVAPGHKVTKHNIESPINLLEVQELEFYSGSVSWTDAPGKYYISTMNRDRLKKYANL
ncbi:histone methylation protein DOT1-domain-containing protein [Dipodascopsis uninucleata]